ncbi:hypothetical protein [Aliivibrio logei]|uniref:hypothetical protein n=1 Tax=Aliivibrio logei TaxID=688 RepID=UPI00039DF183|nr:hypothetical protein [Aliivibrio logei]
MIEKITLIGQATAIISACWAIISGVGAWRREFIGKRKIELAEETLAAFFEIKDAIAFIRSPFASSGEGDSRIKGETETKEEAELLNRGHIVFERYEQKKEVFVRFDTLKYRFMAAYGSDSEAIFVDTNKALSSIFISARQLATHYWQRQGRVKMSEDQFKRHLKKMQEHEDVFWDTWEDTDVVRSQLIKIEKNLETLVAPSFEEQISLFTFLTKKII